MIEVPRVLKNPAQTSRLAACALVALSLVPSLAAGGAWVEEKDSYYFKVAASYLSSTTEFNFSGDEVDILSGEEFLTNTSYRDLSVSLYLEYGLTDRVTVVGSLPFKVLRSKRTELSDVIDLARDVEATNGGMGDATIGLKYPLLVEPLPVSIQGNVKLPLGYDNQPDNGGPPLGSGRVDLEGHLLAGASLYPFPGYVTASAGYRVKTGDLDNEFLFGIEAGASWRRAFGSVGIDGLYSTASPPDIAQSGTGQVSSAVTVTDQDVLKLIPRLGVELSEGIALVVEAFHVIDGKNTVAGTSYAVGVSYEQ